MPARFILIILFLWQVNAVYPQPAEKILLQTDKQWYYPGETIWFAINVYNACGDTLEQLSNIAYVELTGADGKSVMQSKLKIEESQGKGSMTIDNLSSGSYYVVAYTSWMKNFGAATFARKPVYIVNPAKPGLMNTSNTAQEEQTAAGNAVRIETSKKQYGKREPVTINFSTGKPSRVSVSVYRTDNLEKGSDNIYMSHVADPCSVRKSSSLYILEKRGHILSGKVIDRRTQMPAAGILGYLSTIAYPDRLFVAVSDSTGTIRFDIGDIEGKTELVLQTDPSTPNNYTIEINSPFAENVSSVSQKATNDIFQANAEEIDEAMMSAQVQKIFARNDSLRQSRLPGKTYPFYGKPDAFYLMSEYVHFSTVEEILREYIFTVAVQKRAGKLHPIVIDLLTRKPFAQQPLILVNGVPIFDVERFMQMNTDEFHSIGIVAGRYFMGRNIFYGIIDVRLNTPLKEFGVNARVMDFQGTEMKADFLQPDYSNESSRLDRKPDFRSVLYWNPRIKTDNNGNGSVELYTSDLEGEYIAVVQAISADGKVTTNKSTIQVR